MNYIENIYICLAAPLMVAVLCLESYRRRIIIFMLSGMTMCLLSSYINTFLAAVYGLNALTASVEISPTVEEVMKLLPVIFYLLVFEPPKNRMAGNTITVAIGFATFENVCYLLGNDTSNIQHLLIRGFGTGTMHVVTGMVVMLGMKAVWEKLWLRLAGTLGLLTIAIVYHASFNILVSQTGVPAYIGYMFPIVTVIAVLIVKKYRKKLKKYFE
ncbi:MAG: PrsW family intramembrane metalloprotease [Lachnospiraceae bacterium]|nr:PrsW family intramembrane metalloprotease [Lachnospiraceae bacterium]MBR3579955.1 PrsW family intramembrane metalloprotease [Lachnospiraceae bacterium]MBR4542527.1 PrsW family intramembrane metalloprotease [Lachnospiraceae bacterium]